MYTFLDVITELTEEYQHMVFRAIDDGHTVQAAVREALAALKVLEPDEYSRIYNLFHNQFQWH